MKGLKGCVFMSHCVICAKTKRKKKGRKKKKRKEKSLTRNDGNYKSSGAKYSEKQPNLERSKS